MAELPNYYAIIEASVRYDSNIKANEKLLYAEITALTNMNNKCIASNDYFAKLYNVDKATISRWISNLKKHGYIDVILTYQPDGKTIDKRIITLLTKKSIPYGQKNQYPLDEKVKDNINLTDSNSNLTDSNSISIPSSINRESFFEWKEYKNLKNEKEINKVIEFLSQYTQEEQKQIIDTSIMNQYKGLFALKNKNEGQGKANNNNAYSIAYKSKSAKNKEFIDNYFDSMNNSDAIDAEVF